MRRWINCGCGDAAKGTPTVRVCVKTALDGHESLVGRAIQPAACFQQAFRC